MGKTVSPLRYPGGKYKIYDKVKKLIEQCHFEDRTYVEPFAGGFGIGIGLLQDGIVESAIINDFDIHIYHFWHAVLNQTNELVELIRETPITIAEREQQKAIYENDESSSLSDAFATLFLNRVNYSGVIKGGPIGGADQAGQYPLDCRFPREMIAQRILEIARFRDQIKLYHEDAGALLTRVAKTAHDDMFFNIDPPYVVKGSLLYTNFFEEEDHRELARIILAQLQDLPWIVTYDNTTLVREIYEGCHVETYEILHNAGGKARNQELVITNISEDRFVW